MRSPEHSPGRGKADERNPYFKTSPEIIRPAVTMYVRFPLSLPNVEDLLHGRGIQVSYETIRFWWNRFGPIFAAETRKKRTYRMRAFPGWRGHLDEMLRKNGRWRISAGFASAGNRAWRVRFAGGYRYLNARQKRSA